MTGTSLSTSARPRRSPLPDVLGVLWVLAAAARGPGPGVVPRPLPGRVRLGVALRPVEATRAWSSTTARRSTRSPSFIPWTKLAWTQVHHGQLPLWNPYSVLGLPLAFNWQAGTFSVPALLGYLVPGPPRLHRPGAGHPGHRRHRGLRARSGAAVERGQLRHGGHGLRAERPVLRMAGMADRVGDVVDRMAVRRHPARGARPSTGPGPSPSSPSSWPARSTPGSPTRSSCWARPFVVFVAALLVPRATTLGGSGPIRRPLLDTVLAVGAGAALERAVAPPRAATHLGLGPHRQEPEPGGLAPEPRARPLPGLRRTAGGRQPVLRVRLLHEVRRLRRGHRRGARRRGGRRRGEAAMAATGGDRLRRRGRSPWPGSSTSRSSNRRSTASPSSGACCGAGPRCPWPSPSPCWPAWGQKSWCALHRRPAAAAVVRRSPSGRRRCSSSWPVGIGPGAAPARGGLHPGPELHLARGRHRARCWRCAWPWPSRRGAGRAAHAPGRRTGGSGPGRRRGVAVLLACRDGLPREPPATPLWSSSPTYVTPTRAEATLARAVGSSVVGLRGQHVLRRPARDRARLQRGPRHQAVRRVRAPHPSDLRRVVASQHRAAHRPGAVPRRALLGVLPGGDDSGARPGSTASASSSRRPARRVRAARSSTGRWVTRSSTGSPTRASPPSSPSRRGRGDAARLGAPEPRVLPVTSHRPGLVEGA